MNSLEKHIQQTLALTNSLVIKITDVAFNMNRGLSYDNVEIPADKRQWKYYLNLAGLLHSTNKPFMVKLVETEETIEVGLDLKRYKTNEKTGEYILDADGNKEIETYSKTFPELLEEYPYTKLELMKQETAYKKLINSYPEEELYIKGCLFPVDLETAINAKDGTILNWNKDLVEENEYNLIKELETHVINFLKRWHVSAYTLTDELYIPAMLGVLYSSIPGKILNLRLDKILTNEVNSFHMEQFFKSKLDIWSSVQIFKNETKFWLYKNLPYLIKHTGSNEALQIVVDKIFEANGIGIGEYVLQREDPELIKDSDPSTGPSYAEKKPIVVGRPLNASYDYDPPVSGSMEDDNSEIIINDSNDAFGDETEIVDEADKILEELLQNEIRLTNQEFADDKVQTTILQTMKNKLKNIHNLNINQQETKILDIKISRVFKRSGTDVFKTIMDYWSYLCYIEALNGKFEWNTDDAYDRSENKVRPLIEFTDPNTKTLYNLTPKQGLLFAIKLMLMITGRVDDKISSYHFSKVFHPDKYVLKYIWDKLNHDGWTDELIEDMIEHYPRVNVYIYNQYSFNDYLNKIFDFQYYLWALDVNSESIIVSANLKTLLNYAVQNGEFDLIEKEDRENGIDSLTIDEIINKTGVSFELHERYKPLLALNALIGSFTGFNINEYYVKEEIIESCKTILSKLTAYTTQVLTTSDTISSVYLYYNNTGIWRAKQPILGDVDAELHGLEHNFFKIGVQGRNIIEDPMIVLVNNDLSQASYEVLPPASGFGYYENIPDVFSKREAPRAIAEVSETFNFDLTKGHLDDPKEKPTEPEKELKSVSDPVLLSGETTFYVDEGVKRFEFRTDKGSKFNVLVPTGKGIARVVHDSPTAILEFDPPDIDSNENITIHVYSSTDNKTSNLVPIKIIILK